MILKACSTLEQFQHNVEIQHPLSGAATIQNSKFHIFYSIFHVVYSKYSQFVFLSYHVCVQVTCQTFRVSWLMFYVSCSYYKYLKFFLAPISCFMFIFYEILFQVWWSALLKYKCATQEGGWIGNLKNNLANPHNKQSNALIKIESNKFNKGTIIKE